jgi:hypothetical protein
MQTINFGLTLQDNKGTVDFSISRTDHAAIFDDADNPGSKVDYWEQDNIDQTTKIQLDLPEGEYDINLDLVTNVNFDFSVEGVIVSLTPPLKTVDSTQVMDYTLTV